MCIYCKYKTLCLALKTVQKQVIFHIVLCTDQVSFKLFALCCCCWSQSKYEIFHSTRIRRRLCLYSINLFPGDSTPVRCVCCMRTNATPEPDIPTHTFNKRQLAIFALVVIVNAVGCVAFSAKCVDMVSDELSA